eukprot:9703865-Lingulodinium_polyedra.AAC.1
MLGAMFAMLSLHTLFTGGGRAQLLRPTPPDTRVLICCALQQPCSTTQPVSGSVAWCRGP